MAGRYRGRPTLRKSSDVSSADIVEEPVLNLAGKNPEQIYRLTLLDSANAKRSNVRRLSQLTQLVRLTRTIGSLEDNGIAFAAFLRIASFGLCDPGKEIRAATFRAIRYHTTTKRHCIQLQEAHVDFYLARALDLSLDNEVERLQALLLIRKKIQLSSISSAVVAALTALAAEGGEERERMTRIALEILCEMLVYCPDHQNLVSVLRVLMEFLLESNSVPLTSAVVAAVARFSARSDNGIPSSFCDISQILHPVTAFEGIEEGDLKQEGRISKTVMIQAAKNAIVAAFRTWEGVHLLTATSSGIRSLVGVLFLSNRMAQEAVLDIIAVLLYLPDDCESPFNTCPDSWSLQENFVADEARAVLPHIGRTRVNLCSSYVALLLFVFHQNGLIDGLVHLITADGGTSRFRAFRILSSFLALAVVYLPAEFTGQMQSLPCLVSLAADMNKSTSRVQGADIVADLFRSCCNQGNPVRCAGVFLEHVLEICAPGSTSSGSVVDDPPRDVEGISVLRDTVASMTNHEFDTWHWQSVASLLKAKAVRRDEPLGYKFLHRLSFFYKPSNKLFASVLKKNDLALCYTRCGCLFVELLVRESADLLEDLLMDLYACLVAVRETPSGDVIFNPLKLFSTCAADYFIFIGRVSSSIAGQSVLARTGIFQLLMDFVTELDVHESYIKLIATTLNYHGVETGQTRLIFEKIMVSPSPALRCYAALHLRTLLRARMPNFSSWGMAMLLILLSDGNTVVARTAVEVVDEACDEKANLDVLVQANPTLYHLSPVAEFLTARILGTVLGFDDAVAGERVVRELDKWRTHFNRKYVMFVEQSLNGKLLAGQFLPDGMFHRSSSTQSEKFLPELFLPEHLYGQLARHPDGCDIVRQEIPALMEMIKGSSKDSLLDVKAALWALGHVGRTSEGLALLNEADAFDPVIRLVADHDNVSVRGTAFFIVGLWSTTERGADLLKSRDWLAVRHDRHEIWPLVDQRVQYTWEDTTHWMASQSLGLSSSSFARPKSARILSYTTRPSAADVRVQSPGTPFENQWFNQAGAVIFDQLVLPVNGGLILHKSSRGESGFESSDGGGLLDSSGMNDVDGGDDGLMRQSRSHSARTNVSEFSNASVDSPLESPGMELEPQIQLSVSPEGPGDLAADHSAPKQKLRPPFAFMRSKSGFHGSVDEVVSRPRRSESRNSFRDITNSIKQVVMKRHSNHSAPFLALSTQEIVPPSCRLPGESSAKEERFLGICLPVRRSVWSYRPVEVPESPLLVQYDVACRHGSKTATAADSEESSETGLEIHTIENCLVCSVAGQDLSCVQPESVKLLQRKEILRFIWTLATPLGHKAAEQGLLQLKNQLPVSFSDPCLYTEVCHLLAAYTYKLSVRRLIQELFLDVPLQKALARVLEKEILLCESVMDGKMAEREEEGEEATSVI